MALGATNSPAIDSGLFDFLDLGCSQGASLQYGIDVLGGTRGIGIDIDPRKAAATRAAGYDVLHMDATQLRAYPACVSFALMFHFLEHLPSLDLAKGCISAASIAARDFVVVRQPWFDADDYLKGLGLKFYWSHWTGHTNHMQSAALRLCFDELQRSKAIAQFAIYGNTAITSSRHTAIHPLTSPKDQHAWSAEKHPPKPDAEFNVGIFGELCAIAVKQGTALAEVERKVNFTARLHLSPLLTAPLG